MKKCSECGRNLKKNENDLCPACEASNSHKTKKWTLGSVGIIAAGIAIKILTGGKGGGKA